MSDGASVPLNGDSVKKIALTSFGVSGGAVSAYLAITMLKDVVKAEPRMILQTLTNWGPLFFFAMVIVFLGDKRFGEMITVSRENADAALQNAKAMQELADGVRMIASRDDQRAREQELLLDHLNSTNQRIFDSLDAIQESIGESKRKGASA
jgi:hypothetical protein